MIARGILPGCSPACYNSRTVSPMYVHARLFFCVGLRNVNAGPQLYMAHLKLPTDGPMGREVQWAEKQESM